MLRERVDRWFERLAELQIRRPFVPLAVVLVVSAIGAWLAMHLELRTRFDQLLPEHQPSVMALHDVERRTDRAQTAMLLLEHENPFLLRAFGDAVVTHASLLGPETVSSIEDGAQAAAGFLRPRAGLFLEQAELERLRADLDERRDWEVAHATGTSIDDTQPPPKIRYADIEQRLRASSMLPWVSAAGDAYYMRADGKALVVVVRSPLPLGDIGRVERAVDELHKAVDDARSENPRFEEVHARWTGDMIAGLVEYRVVRDDLLHVGLVGLALVLGVVIVYFMRVRALLVMAMTIACGLACTFGITEIAIGHLNVATGFLFSIIAGNGINVGILYLSRYYEERTSGATMDAAVRTAHQTTWPATIVAAIASAAAYSSLLVTHFRTFEQFAVIGASGMLTCWVVTVVLLPALLVLVDSGPDARRRGVSYGQLFAGIVPRAPRLVLLASVGIACAGVVSAVRYVASDPMEYDLTRIQDDDTRSDDVRRAWAAVTDILGKVNDAMVVVTNDARETPEVEHILQERWREAPENEKPFATVRTLFDFVPGAQQAKLPTLLYIADSLRRAHERRLMSDHDWETLAPLLPPPDLKPFGPSDLPAALVRPFSERDGTRGTVVLVEPSLHENTNDLHYLLRYADSFRDVRLADGTMLHGAGRALVFADILHAVVTEVPKAVVVSLGLTVLAVVLTFRRGAHSGAVLAALLVGFGGLALFMTRTQVRLNFLNYIALPVTFGIGVDYAVNIMQRYEADGQKDIIGTLRTTGGAVVLCSLTTMLGYLALLGSHNQAIRSLGKVAVAGEVSCLLAAMLALPAGIHLLFRESG